MPCRASSLTLLLGRWQRELFTAREDLYVQVALGTTILSALPVKAVQAVQSCSCGQPCPAFSYLQSVPIGEDQLPCPMSRTHRNFSPQPMPAWVAPSLQLLNGQVAGCGRCTKALVQHIQCELVSVTCISFWLVIEHS